MTKKELLEKLAPLNDSAVVEVYAEGDSYEIVEAGPDWTGNIDGTEMVDDLDRGFIRIRY